MKLESLDNIDNSSPETLKSGEIEEPYLIDFTAEQAETESSEEMLSESTSGEANQGINSVILDLGPVTEQLKDMQQLQTETLQKLEQIYNNDTYMNLSICICFGLIIGQLLLLGFWRARRRG